MIYLYISINCFDINSEFSDGLLPYRLASRAVFGGFVFRPGHTKAHHKIGNNASLLGTNACVSVGV